MVLQTSRVEPQLTVRECLELYAGYYPAPRRPNAGEYGYTLIEYDPERPWIMIRQGHRTVTLDAGLNFFEWPTNSGPHRAGRSS